MAINWGVNAVGSGTYTSPTPVSTSSVTSSASGSSFLVVAIAFAGGLTFTVTDNKSNTYSLVPSSTVSNNTSDGVSMGAYLCTNGTGGSGHTFSVTASANVGGLNFYAVEITGGATSSIVDTFNGANTGFLGNPTTDSVTTSNANDLILAVMQNNSNTVTTFTPGSGFTNIAQRLADGSILVGRVVSATGTYTPGIAWSPSGGRNQQFTIALKAGGSGPSVAVLTANYLRRRRLM